MKVKLNLKEIANGVEKKIKVKKYVPCSHCHGSGAEGSEGVKTCDTCKGSGVVTRIANTILGQMQTQTTCPTCGGEGKIVVKKCTECNGEGVVRDDEIITINIPAGVADGQVIKLKGYGAEGVNGGPTGDLYITFVIADDPVFKRLGDDLYVDVEVDLYSAILGGEKVIDTLDGKVKLKIKPETQNGTKVRLKGKGFPVYKKEGQFGDLIVTYSVKIPTNLTDKQKELFRQLQSMN